MAKTSKPTSRAKAITPAPAEAKAKPKGSRFDASLAELNARLREIADLEGASAMLGWDQATYMPPGAAELRGRQSALINRLIHERMTDPEIGRLLDRLEKDQARLSESEATRALVEVTRRDYERSLRVPSEFVVRASKHGARSYAAWVNARPANDFETMAPLLEETVRLARERAQHLGGGAEIMDPLIDGVEPDMTARDVRALFDTLRPRLVDLVRLFADKPRLDDAVVRQRFPAEQQIAFGLMMAERFGYDLRRGRQDRSPHPFCTTLSLGDVRITTRVREDDLGDALYSTLHETGHAMYEQGCDPAYEGTLLAGGCSAGVHESQSRLWENLVGRSRGFVNYALPILRKTFPRQLGRASPEAFYRAINVVQPSLIRTDADELTYNLHVMIRFDLECDLLEGRLQARDLPEAWRARYQSDLGVTPPDHRDGCLQDVHWYGGYMGGSFQSYTIGNILSAQFFEAAVAAHPDIPARIERGEFAALHDWLKANVWRHGRCYKPAELVRRATSKDMTIEPYVTYLSTKYTELAAAA